MIFNWFGRRAPKAVIIAESPHPDELRLARELILESSTLKDKIMELEASGISKTLDYSLRFQKISEAKIKGVSEWARWEQKIHERDHVAKQPINGEKLLLIFLSKDQREIIPGDLEEEFREIAHKHGIRFAKRWYWFQVMKSIGPVLNGYARKLALIGFAVKVFDYVKRML